MPNDKPTGFKLGDVNGDGFVDALDLCINFENFNTYNTTYAQGDVNADGTINLIDASTILGNFGL